MLDRFSSVCISLIVYSTLVYKPVNSLPHVTRIDSHTRRSSSSSRNFLRSYCFWAPSGGYFLKKNWRNPVLFMRSLVPLFWSSRDLRPGFFGSFWYYHSLSTRFVIYYVSKVCAFKSILFIGGSK